MDSLDKFFHDLLSSGLMTADQLNAFRAELHPEQSDNARAFAKALIDRGRLTRFQAQSVSRGKVRGLVLGGYVVLDKIGEGGMGQVFKARHEAMDRVVALKVLPPAFTNTPDRVARFRREVKAAARLEHPNVVTAYDAGDANGVHFLVMQFVQGTDLSALVKKNGPLTVPTALDYLRQAAEGLAYAHAQGVVHRDVKPSNLMVDGRGTVKVMDLGLARLAPAGNAPTDDLTATGAVMGTVDYMAPEQARDTGQADERSDVYSLGCTLHYLLTGRPPYKGNSIASRILAHQNDPVPSLRATRPEVSPEADAAFQTMLAKRPEERYQTAGEVVTALRACPSPVAVMSATKVAAGGDRPAGPAEAAERTGDHSDQQTLDSLTPAVRPRPPARPRRSLGLLVGGFLVGAVTLLGIAYAVVTLATTGAGGTSEAKATSSQAKVESLPAWTPPPPIPVGQSPFDRLDPNAIPKEERFAWQPKELVGLIGTHARRMWKIVAAVAISDGGTKAAAVELESSPEVIVWDVATQTPLRRFRLEGGQAAERLEFAEKDTRLYLFGHPSIQLWDIAADPPKRLPIPDPPKYVARFSGWFMEGGKTYCACNNDGSGDVALFSLDGKGNPDGERRKVSKLRIGWPVCVADPANDSIIYPALDNTLCRAKVKDAKFVEEEVLPIKMLPNDFPRGLSSDGKQLVVADERGLAFWDIAAKQPRIVRRILRETLSPGGYYHVDFSPCGRWLAIRSDASGAMLWRVDGPEPKLIAPLDLAQSTIGGATFSHDGNSLVIGDCAGFVFFWDLRGPTPKELSPFDPDTASAHGEYQYHSTLVRLSRPAAEIMVPRFDREPEKKLDRWQTWAFDGAKPRPSPGSMDFLLERRSVATRFWPTSSGKWLFSPWSWVQGGTATLYGYSDGRWQPAGQPFGDPVPQGLVTPDGKLFIALAGERALEIEGWDVTAGPARKWRVPYPGNQPWNRTGWEHSVIASSHDGSRFAIAVSPNPRTTEATIWRNLGAKPEHQATLALKPDCTAGWYVAAMSPDGRFLAHSQTTLTPEPEVLDLTGKEPQPVGLLPKVVDEVHWLAYSPDGRHLAAAGDRGVAVFDAKTLQPVWMWDTAPGPVLWLDWAADGRHLVTHNGNKTIYALRLPPTAVGQAPR